jgi:predicted peroxiredoxin
MSKETYIVLISVDDFSDGRKIANRINKQNFKNPNAVRKEVRKDGVDIGVQGEGEVQIYSLEQFMETCNDQELQSLEGYWISYAILENSY